MGASKAPLGSCTGTRQPTGSMASDIGHRLLLTKSTVHNALSPLVLVNGLPISLPWPCQCASRHVAIACWSHDPPFTTGICNRSLPTICLVPIVALSVCLQARGNRLLPVAKLPLAQLAQDCLLAQSH